MSLTAVVLFMAVVGAALFAAAGFLLARARAGELAPAPQQSFELPVGDAQLAQQNEELHQRLAEAEQAVSAKSTELERCAQTSARLQAEATKLQAEVGRLQTELATARGAAKSETVKVPAAPEPTLGDDGLRAQLLKAEARVSVAEQRERQLSSELATLRKGLDVAGGNLAGRDSELQRVQKDLARVRGELEKACDEIASLRLDRTRAEQANVARAALEKEVKQLKAAQFAATASGAKPLKAVDISLKGGGSSGGALEDLVHRVQSEGQYESVAIADELGLTAAGVGPHIDELAAFTSLLLGVSARASRFFPMQDFGHAMLTDAHGISIEARPVAGSSGFVLLTLGAGNSAETL